MTSITIFVILSEYFLLSILTKFEKADLFLAEVEWVKHLILLIFFHYIAYICKIIKLE
jgi:hypothetical protein